MFSVVLMDAYRCERPEIRLIKSTDGNILDSRYMKYSSTVYNLLCAHHCMLNTAIEENM
ncbi:unnamed protein product [Dibothriocephalus latus]|uniref:Uncharacterized protein n=1 Tax=Dibothriocephalus latus TaxID=60516 RepID=A0A3P7NK95_DIBLA|nr:unnamed protein product [Dibothriocephalus latus]